MSIFLKGCGNHIKVGEHLLCDFTDGLVPIALFIHLNEVTVFCPSCTVHNKWNIVLVCNLGNLSDILHGNSLSAYRVIGNCRINQRNILHTYSLNQLVELINVHISLKRILLIFSALWYLK